MPINSCSSNGNPGYKWGDGGKCYTYSPDSESSKKDARKKALAQGIASGDIDIERVNEVTTGSMGSGIKYPQKGYGRKKKIKKSEEDLISEVLNELLNERIVRSYESFLDEMALSDHMEAVVLSSLEKEVMLPPDDQEEEGHGMDFLDMLDPEERMFANALIAIAEKYGKFNADDEGVWVEYIPPEENDNAEIGVKCGNCALHESENVCRIISSPIHPEGNCRLAIIPKGYVKPEEDDDMEDDDMEDEMEKVTYGRPGPNDPRKTPAKPSERRTGSRRNRRGSAESGSSVTFSQAITSSLKTKMEAHNKKTDASSKKATLSALKAVYRRGAGAFSVSHRPGMTRGQWAMARVNAYLYLLRNGRPSNPNYTTDNDLLPKGHPRSSK